MMKKISAALCLLLLLGCSAQPSTDAIDDAPNQQETKYAFPNILPQKEVLDEQYQKVFHDLSPFEEYHFTIVIPKGWGANKSAVDFFIEPGGISEMGVFKETGRFTDITRPEITLYAAKTDAQPQPWLEDLLEKQVSGYKILQVRDTLMGHFPAHQKQIQYTLDDTTYISLWTAIDFGDTTILAIGSATNETFNEYADAFFVATASFGFGAEE